MSTYLEEYINYYKTLTEPGYAVLVTGKWGVGKTYQVKKILPESERYYVSLFGVTTVEQLHAEVFAAASPKMAAASSAVDKASETAASVGGLLSLANAGPSLFNAIFKLKLEPELTLIFDDLERSNLELKDALGAINWYLEHKGFRVIVIAHDRKMTKKFKKMKEKAFGHTIRVEPQISESFEAFVLKVGNPRARVFIKQYETQILEVFQSSEIGSLRILRHVVRDLERLVGTLTEKHTNQSDAMLELVNLFVAIDIEIRGARLNEKDLYHRRGVDIIYRMKAQDTKKSTPKKPALIVASDRYNMVDLESNLLSDSLLCSMFIEGCYPSDQIQNSLDRTSYFIDPEKLAPWRIVIDFDQLEDAAVEKGLASMEQQICDRSVSISGEILHIFSLKLMMAEYGIQDGSLDDVVKLSCSYIDDLVELKKLPPREADWRWYDHFERSFEGHGYWVTENAKPYFKKIWDHLIAAREQVFTERYPKVIEGLLEMVRSDSSEFFEQVSPTNNGENPYASIPILHHIDAEQFVDEWLSSPIENWRYVYHAIGNRYSHGRIETELADEKGWALQVYHALEARAASSDGFLSLRIRRIIPNELTELAKADR